MSLSSRQNLRLLIGTFQFLLFLVFAWRAEAQACPERTYRDAIGLFRALYPELRGREILLDFESHPFLDSGAWPLNFDISISELRPAAPMHESSSSADRVGHLVAHFHFDGGDHQIVSILASGAFLNTQKLGQLTKLVDEHPDWSELQMKEALVAAGANFGPDQKDAVLGRFSRKELEPILGKIDIISATFTFRGNNKPPFYAVLEWTVHFRTIGKGKQDDYTATLEPFEGKITMLGRRSLNRTLSDEKIPPGT